VAVRRRFARRYPDARKVARMCLVRSEACQLTSRENFHAASTSPRVRRTGRRRAGRGAMAAALARSLYQNPGEDSRLHYTRDVDTVLVPFLGPVPAG
jgi:hypothetical protein